MKYVFSICRAASVIFKINIINQLHQHRHHIEESAFNRLPFNEFLLRQINERLHWFMDKHVDHSLLDTDAQVARALCGLLHPLHNPSESPQLRLSQEELASMASLSRPRCNQALSRMRARGWIRTGYGGITLLDVDALLGMGS